MRNILSRLFPWATRRPSTPPVEPEVERVETPEVKARRAHAQRWARSQRATEAVARGDLDALVATWRAGPLDVDTTDSAWNEVIQRGPHWVRAVLAAGIDPNGDTGDSHALPCVYTPLMTAMLHFRPEIVDALLAAPGIDIGRVGGQTGPTGLPLTALGVAACAATPDALHHMLSTVYRPAALLPGVPGAEARNQELADAINAAGAGSGCACLTQHRVAVEKGVLVGVAAATAPAAPPPPPKKRLM